MGREGCTQSCKKKGEKMGKVCLLLLLLDGACLLGGEPTIPNLGSSALCFAPFILSPSPKPPRNPKTPPLSSHTHAAAKGPRLINDKWLLRPSFPPPLLALYVRPPQPRRRHEMIVSHRLWLPPSLFALWFSFMYFRTAGQNIEVQSQLLRR